MKEDGRLVVEWLMNRWVLLDWNRKDEIRRGPPEEKPTLARMIPFQTGRIMFIWKVENIFCVNTVDRWQENQPQTTSESMISTMDRTKRPKELKK